MKLMFVYITTKDKKQARMIGKSLVKEKLAACANIIDNMNSIYSWNGKLCDACEAVLIVKTRSTLLAELTKRIKQLHSYEVPCIEVLPIVGGDKRFLDWIVKETKVKK